MHNVVDKDGVVIATYYLDSAGAPVDTSGGAVVLGACSLVPPDVEWVQLCDLQADDSIVEFLRRSITTFDALGTPTVTVTDWALDKVTAYAPTGVVVSCEDECTPEAPAGVQTSWAALR
ncbi:MAG: hypothetical protein WAS51_14435 [Ilumatobacteraceae bacterium]